MRFSLPLSLAFLVFLPFNAGAPTSPSTTVGRISPELREKGLQILAQQRSNGSSFDERSLQDLDLASFPFEKRDSKVSATTSCRTATYDDFYGLSDAQFAVFVQNINNIFAGNKIVADGTNLRSVKGTWFRDKNAWNGPEGPAVGPMNPEDVDSGGDIGTICLDGSRASLGDYYENTADCFGSSFTASGTLNDAGTVTIEVNQGYTVGATVVDGTSSTIGGSLSVSVSAEFVVASVEATATISYETTKDHSTESTKEQSISNTVSIQISPPAGYQCNLKISQRSCPGEMDLTIPYTFQHHIKVNFEHTRCLSDSLDPGCQKGSHHFWYIPIDWLLVNSPDTVLTQQIKTAVTSNGQYAEQCFPSDQSGTPSDGGSISTAYQPTLNCPKNLNVIKNSCSAQIGDYLSDGTITGDTSNWANNEAVFVQNPGPQTSVNYGQNNVDFSIKTPYHEAHCSALLQVVPPWGATFLPESSVLQTPQDSSKVSAQYTVGYVSKCDDSQYGTCQIKKIESRNAPSTFSYSQTSPNGNPIQVFDFSNSGQPWPDTDRLTFTLTCKDVYGNSGEVQNFQDVVRGDVKTETLTAHTSTFTLHSTTKYLFTSIQTYFTSVVTPVVTSTLKTATLYTGTVYTSTATLTGFRAAELTETSRITTIQTIPASKTKTIHPTVTPDLVLSTSTKIHHPKTTILSTIKSGVSTVKSTATSTSTCIVTETLKPTRCPAASPNAVASPMASDANQRRKIISTTTTTDQTATATATDYTDTFENDVSSTIISIDYTDAARTTLDSTSTIFDPFGTQITSGVFYGVSTTILGSYTTTTRTTKVLTTTSTSTRIKTQPTTLAGSTSIVSADATQSLTSTIFTTVPKKTVTSVVSTKVKTVTITSTSTPKCTKKA